MPTGPKDQKPPMDVIGNAVHFMRIATGEVEETAPVNDEKTRPRSRSGHEVVRLGRET